jgi:hypothetical protein
MVKITMTMSSLVKFWSIDRKLRVREYDLCGVGTLQIVPHDEGYLPEAGEGPGGAGRDHAVMLQPVVQRVRVVRRLAGHRGEQ